jgi:hypothetical protein
MRKVEDYMKHAQECRTLARNMAPGEQRDQLLNMAQTWELLAQERRHELEKQGATSRSHNGSGEEALSESQ